MPGITSFFCCLIIVLNSNLLLTFSCIWVSWDVLKESPFAWDFNREECAPSFVLETGECFLLSEPIVFVAINFYFQLVTFILNYVILFLTS